MNTATTMARDAGVGTGAGATLASYICCRYRGPSPLERNSKPGKTTTTTIPAAEQYLAIFFIKTVILILIKNLTVQALGLFGQLIAHLKMYHACLLSQIPTRSFLDDWYTGTI